MARPTARALGRPPASISADTRERILAAGLQCFALQGYDKTTIKDIAGSAGLTTGALYHYFDSKQSLFVAVVIEQDAHIAAAYEAAAAGADTVAGQLSAMIVRTNELHCEEEHLARFIAIAPIEIHRHPEFQADILAATGTTTRSVKQFVEELVEAGQANGEIDPSMQASAVTDMLLSVVRGLAQLTRLVPDPVAHAQAVDAYERLFDGRLLVDAPGAPRGGRRAAS